MVVVAAMDHVFGVVNPVTGPTTAPTPTRGALAKTSTAHVRRRLLLRRTVEVMILEEEVVFFSAVGIVTIVGHQGIGLVNVRANVVVAVRRHIQTVLLPARRATDVASLDIGHQNVLIADF